MRNQRDGSTTTEVESRGTERKRATAARTGMDSAMKKKKKMPVPTIAASRLFSTFFTSQL